MALSPDIRSMFQGVTPSQVKRIIAGRPVRVTPAPGGLYLLARDGEELILVEPRIRPRGGMVLAYSIRDDGALADVLDRLEIPGREEEVGRRSGDLGRSGRSVLHVRVPTAQDREDVRGMLKAVATTDLEVRPAHAGTQSSENPTLRTRTMRPASRTGAGLNPRFDGDRAVGK